MVLNIYCSYFECGLGPFDNAGVTEQNSSCFSRWLWKYCYLSVLTNVILVYLEIRPDTKAVSKIALFSDFVTVKEVHFI